MTQGVNTRWEVLTSSGIQHVEANRMEVTTGGALVLSDNSGFVVKVFAPGIWITAAGIR